MLVSSISKLEASNSTSAIGELVDKQVISLPSTRLMPGSSLAEVRNRALNVFRGALMALCDTFKKQIPDAEDRKKFAQEVKADLENPDYCFYSISYSSLEIRLSIGILLSDVNQWPPSSRGSLNAGVSVSFS
jgi:hypothetical protein